MTDQEKQELNELVAKKLGWISDSPHGWIRPKPHKEGFLIGQIALPNYVGSIVDAWELVSVTMKKGAHWNIGDNDTEEWYVEVEEVGTGIKHIEVADTAPEAICRAFLKLP